MRCENVNKKRIVVSIVILLLIRAACIILIKQVEINPPEIEDVLGTSEEKRNMFNNRLDIELPEYTEVKNISIYKRYHTIRTFAEIVIPEQNYNDFISGLDVMEELSIEEKVEIWEVMTKKVKWVQLT